MSDQDSDSIMMPPPKKPRIEQEEYDTPKLEQSNIDFADDSLESNTEFSLNGSKYEDFVNPEEVERLKEFQVLDEVKSNDEDSDEESDSSDGKSEGLPEDEIERMLDEDLPDSFKEAPKPKEKPYVTRQKIILEEKGINHFEVLPLDWMMVRHYSGMPVYMHRASRVCTLSKPYLLGKGNTRRHDIPISAIPCLNYRRALEEEAKQKEIDRRIAEQIKNGTWKKSNTTVSNDKPNGQNTHKEAPLKTNDNIAPGDNVETNQSISECLNTEITKTSDTFEKTIVSNVELNQYIALLDDRHDVETISNLESRGKTGTEEIPPEQQNGIDHSEEIDLTGSALFNNTDRGKSRCPFIHKQKGQDSQECPISNSNVEDETESSVECKTREKEEKCPEDQSSPKTTVGSEQNGPENEEVLIKAENESPKPEENGTELTPSEQNPEENPELETMEIREQETVEHREQEIVENREQEIVGNREQEIVGNREQEIVENREQETVEHREKEKDIVENREQEIVGNREQETVAHREQEIVENREQETVEHREKEKEIVENREQEIVGNREQESVEHREQETVGNREQETLDNREQETPLSAQPVVLPGGIVMPPPRVETVSTSWKTQQLSYEQVNEYCRKLFQFKTVQIMHFKRWADRRKYARARKTLQYPTLPSGTKLITIPAQAQANSGGATEHIGGLLGAVAGKSNKRDWVMNMNGRSYLSVFHEYVRRALQKQPAYEFKQLENAATPYQATVYIGGMQYGVGRGTSKRLAKANAARASIQILIPEMKDDGPAPEAGEPDFSFFDYVGIEDPRITEFCAATCEPSPHATLRTCLLRNFGTGERHIHTEMKKLEYQKIELTMKVGKHSATVVCKNKKTAKQRASQAILQALHPHVRSWGSLLRLYGSRSVKSCKEKKLEEQQITLLQDQARHNEPNYAVLDKLRLEMKRLGERDAAVVPIGTLVLKDDLPSHSGSNLNNVDL